MKKSKMVPISKLPLALRNYETLDRAERKLPKRNFPWGHKSRKCVYCDKVGCRTKVLGGWAHKRCLA